MAQVLLEKRKCLSVKIMLYKNAVSGVDPEIFPGGGGFQPNFCGNAALFIFGLLSPAGDKRPNMNNAAFPQKLGSTISITVKVHKYEK